MQSLIPALLLVCAAYLGGKSKSIGTDKLSRDRNWTGLTQEESLQSLAGLLGVLAVIGFFLTGFKPIPIILGLVLSGVVYNYAKSRMNLL